MVRAWGRATVSTLFWSLRKLDLRGVALVLQDLAQTRCKQKWLKDWLIGSTGG